MKNIQQNKLNRRLKRLFIIKEFCIATEHFINLKLYEKINKYNTTYKEAETLSNLISFITHKDVNPSELLLSSEQKTDAIIDEHILLKESYKKLKKLGFNKRKSESIIRKLRKNTLLYLPNYSISLPYIIDHFILYLINEIDKKVLLDNIFLINFNKKDKIPFSVLKKIILSIEKQIYLEK